MQNCKTSGLVTIGKVTQHRLTEKRVIDTAIDTPKNTLSSRNFELSINCAIMFLNDEIVSREVIKTQMNRGGFCYKVVIRKINTSTNRKEFSIKSK